MNRPDFQAIAEAAIAKAGGKPRERDPRLPACPICGAPAFALDDRTLRWTVATLEHDCDCDLDDYPVYAAAVIHLFQTTEQRERFRDSLPELHRDVLTRILDRGALDFHARPQLQALEPGQFAYLWGPAGTGKTTAAIRAAYDLTGPAGGAFIQVPAWLEGLRRSFRGTGEPPILEAGVIVLDDVGKERPTPWVAERVFETVDAALSHRRSIIFTSQFRPDKAAERLYTDGNDVDIENARALMSRFASGIVLRFGGDDHRTEHLR